MVKKFNIYAGRKVSHGTLNSRKDTNVMISSPFLEFHLSFCPSRFHFYTKDYNAHNSKNLKKRSLLFKMSTEAILTRELGIRFIDARTLVNEAKIVLTIDGYPSSDEKWKLLEEARRIFEQTPGKTRNAMKTLKTELDAVKACENASSYGNMSDSELIGTECDAVRSQKFKFWRRRWSIA